MGGRGLFLLVAVVVVASSLVRSAAGRVPEWQLLTKRNYSSQIRLHPHVLLIVTVPWSGESRSLMKELAQHVSDKQDNLGHLKLMMIFRNSEKMLADVLGAAEGIAIFYYHHSVPYKYQGRLRVQNILSSVYYLSSLKTEEVPLKTLHTKEDLENFFHSTDKAVLLLEFCGWSAKLLHAKKNETRHMLPSGDAISEEDGILEENLTREVDGTFRNGKKTHKVLENEELTCGIENGFAGSSWLGGFSWANESDLQGFENRNANPSIACTPEEFQRFETFFLKLTKVAREFLLPPERQRFGLITEVSLLPFIGVDKPETWSLVLHFSGCSNCSFIFQEGDDLKTVLQMQHPLVRELDIDGQSLKPVFPARRPSIVLFIDRSSDLSEVRGKSKSSLVALRRFVQRNHLPDMIKGPDTSNSAGSSAQTFLENWRKSISHPAGYLTGEASVTPNIVKTKDNMAIMIINDAEHISLDNLASDNPVYDILTRLIHKKSLGPEMKQTKISLLAKEAGFQLLSDDFEVEASDSFPSLKENDQSNDTINDTGVNPKNQSAMPPKETNDVDMGKNNLSDAIGVIAADKGNQHENIDVETVLQQNKEINPRSGISQEVKNERDTGKSAQINDDGISVDKGRLGSSSSLAENSFAQESLLVGEYIGKDHVDLSDFSLKCAPSMQEEQNFSTAAIVGNDVGNVKKSMGVIDEPRIPHQSFLGSFFFCDGGYQLLGTMTAGSKIPSLLIIDPDSQKHYVFSEEREISYSSIVKFVNKYRNGSLTPYQQSELSIISPREMPRPPFVNLDFHESDSIPLVTAKTFCELVIGFKDCEVENELSSSNIQDPGSAWNMDVLVFFSTRWCGFCQRMELIVREVYRALRGYMDMLKSETRTGHSVHNEDMMDDPIRKALPSIFLMDCTLNDCGSILEPLGKKELYPMLLLFPAENKGVISYEGDMSVVSMINFLISHGSNSHYLRGQKGLLWTHEPRVTKSSDTFHEAASQSIQEQTSYAEDKDKEFLLKTPIKKDKQNPILSHTLDSLHDEGQYVAMGSILSATDMLIAGNLFYNSTILIVAAEQSQGFLGLILNKRISWDVLKAHNKEMEPLSLAPLFFGGPVMEHSFPLVSLARKVTKGYTQVIAGFYFGSTVATSLVIEEIKLGRESASDYLFFLGYSGWGWNQLFEELAQGLWHLSSSPVANLDWPDN